MKFKIVLGFKAVLPLITSNPSELIKSEEKEDKRHKIEISIEPQDGTEEKKLKRFWSPVNITTCQWVNPIL